MRDIPLAKLNYSHYKFDSLSKMTRNIIGNESYREECIILKNECDELSIDSVGRLLISTPTVQKSTPLFDRSKKKIERKNLALTDLSFNQLLSFLQIPSSFANRVSTDVLVILVNKMLSESFDRRLNVRLGGSGLKTAMSIFSSNDKVHLTLYEVVVNALNSHLKETINISFRDASLCGLDGSLRCHFLNHVLPNSGVEVFASDRLDFSPTITGARFIKNGVALFKSVSTNISSSGHSRKHALKAIDAAILGASYGLSKISNNIPNVKLNSEEKVVIVNKSSKMMTKPVGNFETVSDALSRVFKYQNDKELPLNEYRRSAFFAGWLIENAEKLC